MISITQLREAARLRSSNESQDAYLKALEKAAVDLLHARSGRYYGPVQTGYKEYPTGDGSRELITEETPGGTLTVVEHLTPGDTGTTITAGDDTGFLVRGRKLVRKGGEVWRWGYEYELTYDRGYTAGQEPPRARQFVTGLVLFWYERRVPLPKVGEVFTFPVPLHLESMLSSLSRLHV
jgi:hypothetical protein